VSKISPAPLFATVRLADWAAILEAVAPWAVTTELFRLPVLLEI